MTKKKKNLLEQNSGVSRKTNKMGKCSGEQLIIVLILPKKIETH